MANLENKNRLKNNHLQAVLIVGGSRGYGLTLPEGEGHLSIEILPSCGRQAVVLRPPIFGLAQQSFNLSKLQGTAVI